MLVIQQSKQVLNHSHGILLDKCTFSRAAVSTLRTQCQAITDSNVIRTQRYVTMQSVLHFRRGATILNQKSGLRSQGSCSWANTSTLSLCRAPSSSGRPRPRRCRRRRRRRRLRTADRTPTTTSSLPDLSNAVIRFAEPAHDNPLPHRLIVSQNQQLLLRGVAFQYRIKSHLSQQTVSRCSFG